MYICMFSTTDIADSEQNFAYTSLITVDTH